MATVTALDGAKAYVRRVGQDAADDASYPVLTGYTAVVDDYVLVHRVGETGYIIMGDLGGGGGGGGGAPSNADYLVGTANAGLSAEIVAGTTPQGELGGTWGAPTVDNVHADGRHWLDKVPGGNGPGQSLDDEFDDGSKDAAWTETAVSGTATWTEDDDVLSCIFNNQTASDAAFIVKTLTGFSTGDYIECAMRLGGIDNNWIIGGLILTDGTGAAANSVAFSLQLGDMSLVRRGGTVTNLGGTVDSSMGTWDTGGQSPWLYMRLTYVSSNTFKGEVSLDGVTWNDFGAADITPTFTPTHGGLFVTSWGGSSEGRLAAWEYFRTSVA
jgi:hypothetical protein